MAGTSTNPEFEIRGFNHLAFVCRDMEETVEWYRDVLGMPLVKTLELPDGGQHFLLDVGNGIDGVAFFWWPTAPEGVPGESISGSYDENMQRTGLGGTAIGTLNHVAFDVPAEMMDEYLVRLRAKGVKVTDITNHATSTLGKHKEGYDAATDGGDVFVRSMYFRDPNGVLLEFAAWTRALDADDVVHTPKTAADRAAPAGV